MVIEMDKSIIDTVIDRLSEDVFPIVSSSLRRDITRMLTPQMDYIDSLSPVQRMLMIESIVRRYRDASIKEHEPVGVNAALTTGENLTQSSLQSHHHAGLKRGAAGFDRVEEITNMRNESNIVKVITTPHNVLGALVPRPKEEINEIANLLVKVMMDTVVYDYDIVGGDMPKWYEIYTSIKAIPLSALKSRWLRIYIDKDIIYRHRISMPAIASVVSDAISSSGYVLYAPVQIGTYIDVHLNTTNDAEYYMKLSNILSLQVGGIESVESAAPIPENLLTNLHIYEVDRIDDRYVYDLATSTPAFIPPFAWERMITAMVPDAQMLGDTGKRFSSSYQHHRIKEMMLQVPMIYADIIESRTIDSNTGDTIITFDTSVVDRYPYLEYANLHPRIFSNEDDADKFLLEVMVEYHYFWYIEAVCGKVQDLYVLPEVDSTRTYTTSALDCRDNLGYMAMRNMIYEEFKDNISINPIHIKIIINNMTLYKKPVSIKRQSIHNDKSEWLTYCTFEDVLKYITSAAFAGETDNMQSVSSHVLTGRMIDIGRGGKNLKPVSKDNPTGNRFIQLQLDSIKKAPNRVTA